MLPARGGPRQGRSGRGGAGQDIDQLAALAVAELDRAVGPGEQRVVLADADVLPRVEPRAGLADDDRPRAHVLTARHLDPEPLRIGVAAVPGGGGTLLLRHGESSALRDRSVLDRRVLLAVAIAAPVVRLRLVREAVDL